MPKMGDLAAQDDYGDVDWSRMNQPFGQLLDPNPKLYDTKAGPIYQADINQAIDVGMGVSGGGLATRGIKAYHSSPHDFDRFDLSKIGTGEGAQVYGHGLYFAENPAVSGQGGQYWNQFLKRFDPQEFGAATALKRSKFDREAAIADSQYELQKTKDYLKHGNFPETAKYGTTRAHYEDLLRNQQAQHELLMSGKPVGPRTYEVDIKADPVHMLDWDKPLSQQSEQVRAALPDIVANDAKYKADYPHSRMGDPFGSNIYESSLLVPGPNRNKVAATAALQERGIPGIKYLDAQSRDIAGRIAAEQKIIADPNIVPKWRDRAAENLASLLAEKQTSNYVMFDPNIIDIKKIYGLPAAIGAGGMGALAAQDSYQPKEKM